MDYHIVLFTVCFSLFKLLFLPLYYSTDFDVHRNWLALTYSLPIKQWYWEDTSEWTLDYPPFFAWFEWCLAQVASIITTDTGLLTISATPYVSWQTTLFQRVSVIFSDLLLSYAVVCFAHTFIQKIKTQTQTQTQTKTQTPTQTKTHVTYTLWLLILVFCSPGLLLVDHIHFQYNGFLMGLYVLSLALIMRQDMDLAAGFMFAVLLNFKHIFLYVAPVYFVYLLGHYTFDPGHSQSHSQSHSHTSGPRFRPFKLMKMGIIVITTFVISFGPFYDHIGQVISRLFPVKRGLCHAYWAPNFWALYNSVDTVLVRIGRIMYGMNVHAAHTSGLVADIKHVILPTIEFKHTVILTLVSMLPALYYLWRKPHIKLFIPSLAYCSLCSFMFGYHVHEKAILLVIIPLGLVAMSSFEYANLYQFLATVGHYSLFPLFFGAWETPVKCTILIIHTLLSHSMLSKHFRTSTSMSFSLLNTFETVYLWGLVPLQLFVSVVHPIKFSQ
jgi:alpha-1,3-glucosyltransferase